MSEIVSCLNDVECIVTLPIPLSAQDPEHFNIKKAILESPIVQTTDNPSTDHIQLTTVNVFSC